MSYFTQISLRDTGQLDAFNRLRTSNIETLFTTQSQFGIDATELEAGNTGTGAVPAWDANTRMIALSATAGTGTSFVQSFAYNAYQPGKSQYAAMTGVMGTGVANVVKEFGYFDAANGIIYRQNGTGGVQLVLRSSTSGSVAETVVDQANWNLDPFNGIGISGVNLDPAKCFILIIDLQFLGMGRVRVGFDVDGVIYYAHQFLNANILTVPYMQTATLPIQALLTASSSAAPGTCYFKCAAVGSEGGAEDRIRFHFGTPMVDVSVASGVRTHLLSIRPKTTFGGITNRVLVGFDSVELLPNGANPIFWELVLNAAFSPAPAWADVNTTNSAVEYGVGGTYTAPGSPLVVASGLVTQSARVQASIPVTVRYPITLNRAGAQRAMGTLSLLASGVGGTSLHTYACLNFHEIH